MRLTSRLAFSLLVAACTPEVPGGNTPRDASAVADMSCGAACSAPDLASPDQASPKDMSCGEGKACTPANLCHQGVISRALSLHCMGCQYASRPGDDAVFNLLNTDYTIQAWLYFNDLAGEQTFFEKFHGRSGVGWTLTKLSNHPHQR